MTDPETADVTYIEPLTVESVSAIIRRLNVPDALASWRSRRMIAETELDCSGSM